jgi:hypothetical protein
MRIAGQKLKCRRVVAVDDIAQRDQRREPVREREGIGGDLDAQPAHARRCDRATAGTRGSTPTPRSSRSMYTMWPAS